MQVNAQICRRCASKWLNLSVLCKGMPEFVGVMQVNGRICRRYASKWQNITVSVCRRYAMSRQNIVEAMQRPHFYSLAC